MESPARYELVTTASGALSIRDNAVGEIMHNPVGPWEEANLLHVEPLAVAARLAAGDPGDPPLVLFDVGLGAAANALAAIRAAAPHAGRRRLHVVSFEHDLSLLSFTLEHAARIPYVRGHEDALAAILAHDAWESPTGAIRWALRRGDFLATIEAEPTRADLVFHDPYSPGVNPAMWSLDAFTRLRRACGPDALLSTYSIATAVRAAMLLAGFHVGYGPRSGLKRETTQAAARADLLASPLDERWLVRWLRSHARLPLDARAEDADALTRGVLYHPQFVDLVYRTLLPNGPAIEPAPRHDAARRT